MHEIQNLPVPSGWILFNHISELTTLFHLKQIYTNQLLSIELSEVKLVINVVFKLNAQAKHTKADRSDRSLYMNSVYSNILSANDDLCSKGEAAAVCTIQP
jgi:hypothetical protein